MNTLTKEGLALIKSHEGLRLNAYPDPGTGGDPWTIGYGHTSLAGPPLVRKGMKISALEAEDILRRDLQRFEKAVAKAVKVPINDNQFSALVSFCFNVGEGGLLKSGVLKAVNAKRFDLVPARLALWNKAAGRVLPGLTRRRAEEGKLFGKSMSIKPTPSPQAEIEPEGANRTPDAPQGKPMRKSTTFWAEIIKVATAIGAAGFTAIGSIPWQTAIVIAGTVIILGAGWTIRERWLKSKVEGV